MCWKKGVSCGRMGPPGSLPDLPGHGDLATSSAVWARLSRKSSSCAVGPGVDVRSPADRVAIGSTWSRKSTRRASLISRSSRSGPVWARCEARLQLGSRRRRGKYGDRWYRRHQGLSRKARIVKIEDMVSHDAALVLAGFLYDAGTLLFRVLPECNGECGRVYGIDSECIG